MATRTKKPKCNGKTSQSCGMGCISREHTCKEIVASDVANRLMIVAKMHQQPNDASGQSFDSVAANFPASVLKAAHKSGVATKDLGNGATLTTKKATGLDGSSIKYGFVTDADGKRYTVSDGLVKEVTSAAGSEWGEAFDAAVRSKVADLETVSAAKSYSSGIDLTSKFSTRAKSEFRSEMSSDKVTAVETMLKAEFSDLKISVSVSNTVLSKILSSGRIKSQFETGTTTGNEGTLNYDVRAKTELDKFSYPLDTKPESRPIYASASRGETGTAQYGDVHIVLKDSVRQRSTVTLGDSLDIAMPGGTPIDNPKVESVMYNGRYKNLSSNDLVSEVKDSVDLNVSNKYMYIEAQIHGGVSTKDIDKVILPKAYESSEPELLSKLTKQSIPYEFA